MKIDRDLVRKMAELSRVKLSEAEASRLEGEFGEMMKYFSDIDALGREGEQLYYVSGTSGALREDKPRQAGTKKEEADAIVGQFSRKDGRLMVAPKTLD
jgi:aspartyl/glutamyl-tRNA(Asn/Gln) amidotransferase C subunit